MGASRARVSALLLALLVPWGAPAWGDDPPAPPPPAPLPPGGEPPPSEPGPLPPSLPGQPVEEPRPAPLPEEPPPPAPAPAAPSEPVPLEPAPLPAPEPPRPTPEPVTPDSVTLENGKCFEGLILEETAEVVVLEVLGSESGLARITIPRARIATIVRGDGRTAPGPGTVTQRDAWFLLRSGGETVGTRHEVLRSLRLEGQPGFRLEETIVQLPQGRRIPRARFERVEDTDARFLPRRMHYRESVEPLGEDPEALPRFERSVSGSVANDVWTATWRRGAETGRTELSLPPETRGVLGLRELLLRSERVAGVAPASVLDVAENALLEVEAGFAAVASATGGTDELHWVTGGQRRITRYRGREVLEDRVADGIVAVASNEAQARAVEQTARASAADPSKREVTLAEQGLRLTLPGPDWTVGKPVASALDTGRRVVARLTSEIQLAEVRVEWDPEGLTPGITEAALEAALLERLKGICPDLAVAEPRRPAEHLPGAWRMALYGTLRDTPVRTLVLVVAQAKGVTTFLAAVPDTAWESGRPALEKLLSSVRPL